MRCPKCGQSKDFRVQSRLDVIQYVNGLGKAFKTEKQLGRGAPDYSASDLCLCTNPECEYVGRVRKFLKK